MLIAVSAFTYHNLHTTFLETREKKRFGITLMSFRDTLLKYKLAS